MRLIKLISLAAVAALAAMAFVGAGTASADRACETNVGEHNECPSPIASGQLITGLTLASAPATLLTGPLPSAASMKCHSTALGSIGASEGSHTGLLGLITTLNFTNCEGLCEEAEGKQLPALLLLSGLNLDATVNPDGAGNPGALLKNCLGLGIHCAYTLTGGTALLGVSGDTMIADHEPLTRTAGTCPLTAFWDATYLLTLDGTSTPVYLAALP